MYQVAKHIINTNGDYSVASCKLEWTTTPPTEPGLYWYSYKHNGKWSKPVSKEFDFFRGELCEVVCGSDGGEYEPVKDFLPLTNGRILGPLPIPEPPQ
jgi:hypothetical protein